MGLDRAAGLNRFLPIAVGGALGALLRWGIGETFVADGIPWHTLLVNVVGCGLLALVTQDTIPERTQRFLATGFCGGLTTFSTLSLEVVLLLEDGRAATAGAYIVLSLVLGLAAYVAIRSTRPPTPLAYP